MISSRAFYRLGLAGVLLGALALGACGRKGPLDAPPGAAIAPAGPSAGAPHVPPEEQTLFGDAFRRDPSTQPVAPKGQAKRIPLDVLLD